PQDERHRARRRHAGWTGLLRAAHLERDTLRRLQPVHVQRDPDQPLGAADEHGGRYDRRHGRRQGVLQQRAERDGGDGDGDGGEPGRDRDLHRDGPALLQIQRWSGAQGGGGDGVQDLAVHRAAHRHGVRVYRLRDVGAAGYHGAHLRCGERRGIFRLWGDDRGGGVLLGLQRRRRARHRHHDQQPDAGGRDRRAHLSRGERRALLRLRGDDRGRRVLLGYQRQRRARQRHDNLQHDAGGGDRWAHLRRGERRVLPYLRGDDCRRGVL